MTKLLGCKNRVTGMKCIETVDGSELHIREGVLHLMGKRRRIAKDVWIIVGMILKLRKNITKLIRQIV